MRRVENKAGTFWALLQSASRASCESIGPISAGISSVQAEQGGNGKEGSMLLLGHQLPWVMPSQHETMEARGFILTV